MLRRLGCLLLLLVLALAGGGWWAWQRAGSLPDWYERGTATGELDTDLEAAAGNARRNLAGRFGRELLDELTADDGGEDASFVDRLKRRGKALVEGLRDGREVPLDEGEIEELILTVLAEDPEGRHALAAARAVHADVEGEELELGVVIVPSRLPRERLSGEVAGALERLAGYFPGADRALYVGLRGVPAARDGKLYFGPESKIRVGKMLVSPSWLAKVTGRAGVLERGVEVELGRVALEAVRLEGETLVLTVRPRV